MIHFPHDLDQTSETAVRRNCGRRMTEDVSDGMLGWTLCLMDCGSSSLQLKGIGSLTCSS